MRGEFIIFVTIFMVLYLFLILVVLIPQFGMNMVPYLVMFTFLGAAIILSLLFAYHQEALDDVGWESVLVFALLMAALLVVIFVLWFFLKRKRGNHHDHNLKGHFHGLMHGHEHHHGYEEVPCNEKEKERVEVHEKSHTDYVSHGDHVHTRRKSQVHADVHSSDGHLHVDFEGDPGYLADRSFSAHSSEYSSAHSSEYSGAHSSSQSSLSHGTSTARGRNRGEVYHFD